MEQLRRALFPREYKLRDEGRCPFCGKPIKPAEFRDELSRREFLISGLCQQCQDKVFK